MIKIIEMAKKSSLEETEQNLNHFPNQCEERAMAYLVKDRDSLRNELQNNNDEDNEAISLAVVCKAVGLPENALENDLNDECAAGVSSKITDAQKNWDLEEEGDNEIPNKKMKTLSPKEKEDATFYDWDNDLFDFSQISHEVLGGSQISKSEVSMNSSQVSSSIAVKTDDTSQKVASNRELALQKKIIFKIIKIICLARQAGSASNE